MKITGKVITHKLNKSGCAFIAVRGINQNSDITTMFVSETSDALFCGQKLSEDYSVTITALEEQAFKHGDTTYYRPLKVVVVVNSANGSFEDNSEVLDTNTKEAYEVSDKKPTEASPKVHILQRKVYGRISGMDFTDKSAKITVLDNHTETGEALTITFLRIPRGLEDGMRISCNLETSEEANTVKTTHSIYEDERKGIEQKMVKIIYGNARNVAANAIGVKDLEKFNKLAMDVYTKGKIKREELKKEFSDMDDFDLGAKWGDSMKQAGSEYKSVAKIIEVAEVLFRSHVEVEQGLV